MLYVGISLNASARLAQHREHSQWYAQIARMTIERFDSREEALEAETRAIRSEAPKYNIRKILAADPRLSEEIGTEDEIDQSKVDLASDRLYTTSDVAYVLGLNEQTITRYIKAGKLGALVLQTQTRIYKGETRIAPIFRVTAGQIVDFLAGLPVYIPTGGTDEE